jgi:hypothetical protein
MVLTVAEADTVGLPAEVAVTVDELVPVPVGGIDTFTQTLLVLPGATSAVAVMATVQAESL